MTIVLLLAVIALSIALARLHRRVAALEARLVAPTPPIVRPEEAAPVPARPDDGGRGSDQPRLQRRDAPVQPG
ncbi:hypothetical protein, partial [Sphingomonas sp. ABOLH]|uniref:hypothetical protein n=1 Tax=Sphingomonas sp. ABOLH TaxID=1985881 RepID=UPI0019D017EA